MFVPRFAAVFLAAPFAVVACGRRAPAPGGGGGPSESPASSAPSAQSALPPSPASCGDLGCTRYDSSGDAFLAVLRSGGAPPLVLAVGEAHAPEGAAVPSAAARFTRDLLPLLVGQASDLLVELMMPPSGCLDAAAEVREKEAPITSRQAPTDANEYVAMGERARALGIVPDLLRPTCADMDAIRGAGDTLVDVSLTTIARLARAQGGRLLARAADAGAGTVVLYGGALHDKLDPPANAARWSYAPELDAKAREAGGRFVAVDLIVPEFIGQDDTWRSLPWWPFYDAARLTGQTAGKTVLFQTAPRSFVLIFPRSSPAVPALAPAPETAPDR